MSITVVATLEFMAGVYAKSTSGGPTSDRFTTYTSAGADRVPVHGYNPMTSKPVDETIRQLLAIDAEQRLHRVAQQVAAEFGFDGDEVMHLTVATPGMWTDRLATEVDHRLHAPDPGGVLWWFDDPIDVASFEIECAAQTVRLICTARHGRPTSLMSAVQQEGRAYAFSGERGALDPLASEVLAVLGDDTSTSTMVGFLYGHAAASKLGYTPIGLPERVGYRHAVALDFNVRTSRP